MQKLLTGLLTLLLTISLVACSNNNDKEDLSVKNNNTNTKETLSLDDEKYYFEIGSSANLEKDIKLNDGETLKIEGDYDLNKAGSYNVKVIVIDREGKERTFDKEIIVDNKDKLETLKVDNKQESKEDEDIKNEASTPSISTNQPSDKELPKDGEVTIVDNEPEITPSTEDDRDLANDKEVSNGLSTNANDYGLDSSNPFVKAAMDLVGKEGVCQKIANECSNNAGYPSGEYGALVANVDWETIESKLQVGDGIWYHGLNNTSTQHLAVYLGNGLALHGNWGGIAQIANAYQPSDSYTLHRHGVTYQANSGCTDGSCGGELEEFREFTEQAERNVTEEWCRTFPAIDMNYVEFAKCGELVNTEDMNLEGY